GDARLAGQPRHVPLFGGLPVRGGARVREAHRRRTYGRCAAQRARGARVSRHRGAIVSSGGALVLEQVTVARGTRDVVRDVSLTTPPGEVTALLGPNGAGKSSLVLAVGGVLRPRSGRVLPGESGLPRWPLERIRRAGVAV